MFSGWQSFYQTTAEAAATLTGLMFIVATLTAGRQASRVATRGQVLFTTPSVFHFVSVFAISALALTAGREGDCPSAIMTVWSLFGLAYAVWLAVQIGAIDNPSHWSDLGWYGVAPALTYAVLAAACALAWAHIPHAPYAVALALLVLLIIAIRNAWDLVTWLAPRRDGGSAGDGR